MAWVLPINSYLVSGFTILLFNFIVFSAIKALSQSICASQNLHVIYDKRLALEPRRSRLASVFGGPTGPPRLARFFAILIAVFAVLVITLDFSVNGATTTSHVPTVYKSLVRSHPQGKPLVIDYEREYSVDANGTRRASRRLVAAAEAHSCLNLNITHHTMYAYAYRDLNLDRTLIPVSTFLPDAVCVTNFFFDHGIPTHAFEQVPEIVFGCSFKQTRIDLQPKTNGSVIIDANIVNRNSSCDLKFHAVRCFALLGKTHCGIVASKRIKKRNYLIIQIPDHTSPSLNTPHQLREVKNIATEDARVIAANMAYFSALGFDYGVFNAMYMSLAEVVYDVSLNRKVRKNVSEIDDKLAAPVLSIVITATLALAGTAFGLWFQHVYRKKRLNYTTFSSVEEVLAMVRRDGLTKSREGDASDQVIFLRGDRPVLVQEDSSNNNI